MVNVLQAVLLTEGEKLIKTPTYHVFHQYRHHQGAALLESTLTGVSEIEAGEWKVPELTEAVSEDGDGIMTVTINNLSASEEKTVELSFAEGAYQVAEATVVSGELHAHNTFEAPETVKEEAFTAHRSEAGRIKAVLPPASVTMLRLKK